MEPWEESEQSALWRKFYAPIDKALRDEKLSPEDLAGIDPQEHGGLDDERDEDGQNTRCTS